MDRGRVAAIEDGAAARESTIGAIERALSDIEHETGHDEEPNGGLVTFRLFGGDVVVEGPVANLAELEASVERLLRRMRDRERDA